MKWCRLYNDEAENRRVRYVASAAGCAPVMVLGVLFAMKCHASGQQGDKRGTLAGWDTRVVAFDLGIEPPMLMRVKVAMEGHFIDGDRLIDWEVMQYASDGSTERWRKWRDKQTQEKQEDTDAPTLDQRLTNTHPTLDQRVRTEQSRAEEKRSNPSPPKRGDVPARQDEAFERFWQHYPRKVGKGAARKAWPIALKRAEEGADSILAGLITQTSLSRFDLREGMRFCPHAATWLNREGWLDGLADEEPEQARRSA